MFIAFRIHNAKERPELILRTFPLRLVLNRAFFYDRNNIYVISIRRVYYRRKIFDASENLRLN